MIAKFLERFWKSYHNEEWFQFGMKNVSWNIWIIAGVYMINLNIKFGWLAEKYKFICHEHLNKTMYARTTMK